MNNRQAQLFVPLDKLGKWPKGTYLQKRLALVKLEEAQKALEEGEGNGDQQ